MKRRSDKATEYLASLPAIAMVSTDRTPKPPVDESFREFIRRLPCVVCLEPALKGDPCHRGTRRNHGDWDELPDSDVLVGNIFPACRAHHDEQHLGIFTFQLRRKLDLDKICRVIGEAYQAGWSPDGLGVAARASGYMAVDPTQVIDGELPF